MFKATNEITVYLMLKHTQNFQDYCYPIEIIDFSWLGRALKILVSAVRFCLWPPLPLFDCIHFILLRVTVLKILNDKDTRRTRFLPCETLDYHKLAEWRRLQQTPYPVPTPNLQIGSYICWLYSRICLNNNENMRTKYFYT